MNNAQKLILIIYALLVLAAGVFPLHDYHHRDMLLKRSFSPIWDDPKIHRPTVEGGYSYYPQQNKFLAPFFVAVSTLAATALVIALKDRKSGK
jgi:hypothetical protein